jgi:hypothetical protein
MVAERRAKILRRAYYANVLRAASWMTSSVKRSARSLPTSKAGARLELKMLEIEEEARAPAARSPASCCSSPCGGCPELMDMCHRNRSVDAEPPKVILALIWGVALRLLRLRSGRKDWSSLRGLCSRPDARVS